jgi:hypothetical protein
MGLVAYFTRMIEIPASCLNDQKLSVKSVWTCFVNLRCDIQVNCSLKVLKRASCLHFIVLKLKTKYFILWNVINVTNVAQDVFCFVNLLTYGSMFLVFIDCFTNRTRPIAILFFVFLSNFEQELVCCKFCVINWIKVTLYRVILKWLVSNVWMVISDQFSMK